MKVLNRVIFSIAVLFIAGFSIYLLEIPEYKRVETHAIQKWQINWLDEFDPEISTEQLDSLDGWINVDVNEPTMQRPDGAFAQWSKIRLPELNGESSAILFESIYGTHIVVKVEDEVLYDNGGKGNNVINTVLVPVSGKNSHDNIYVGLEKKGNTNTIGISSKIKIGNYQDLTKGYVRGNIATYVLGGTLIFIALIMLVCSLFLNTGNLSMWLSLCAIILTSGFLVITYSSFSYWLHESMGNLYLAAFDVSLFILLPSFSYFFEKTFGPGIHSIVRRFRKFQVIYSLLCITILILNSNFSQFSDVYFFVTSKILGILMIVQFLLLMFISTMYAIKGDRNAIIFSAGFIIFALLGIGELLYYYLIDGYYNLFLWKWGIACFLSSLIIILGRNFAENHQRIVEYSKQLETFNNELQRAERMEIISELAASVAHEVRNPLQVTRGFIQLLVEKQPASEKVYLNMALEELDRASDIITDYLTFAKPEAGKITNLNVLDEFIHIEGILIPMANMQGGNIFVHIPNDLFIKGNSSKFKQAFINIIKNSIEALNGEGEVQIWAYEENEKVHIHIKDTGEGMDEAVLARLGEPYFSNKTKGTGLGLMVTLRIIEVMDGTIKFSSQKGVGTEVVIQFPKACIHADEENEQLIRSPLK